MKYANTNSINKKFSQGFNTILSPTLINLFIALSLLIILALIYLKYKKIELYTNPSTTMFNINQYNLDTDTGYMQNIIDNYIKSIKLKNNLQEILNARENKIQDLSLQINQLIS
jgi:hypothetical protein